VNVIAAHDPDAVVMVLPSDHFIGNESAFRSALTRALRAAEAYDIATIGVVPTRPETGYGYIEVGAEMGDGVSDALRFAEKPDRARAEAYVAGGKHLWNAGMFFFRARAMKDAIAKHLPELARGLAQIEADPQALGAVFPSLPSMSIDHGVMEKAGNIGVIHGEFGWSDVGSWQSAWELAEKDAQGNALPTGGVAIDARGNLVRDLRESTTAKKIIALVGVSDLVVVDTDDALLIIPRDRAQDVREVTRTLRDRGQSKLL
jgi:mannose-1-phosphate guanylyltransferase